MVEVFREVRRVLRDDGTCWVNLGDSYGSTTGNTKGGLARLSEKIDGNKRNDENWATVRGDMNCVGPRPERPHFVAQLSQEIPYYQQRHLIAPGLTVQVRLIWLMEAAEAAKPVGAGGDGSGATAMATRHC